MARTRPHELIAAFAAVAAIAGCAATPPPGAPAGPASVVPAAGNDWRALSPAPFGSSLQDLRQPLHEVLMFAASEPSPAEGAVQDQECYATDGPRPHFLGQDADSDLLCFRHGHLYSYELGASLPAGDAAQRFATYCDAWLQAAVSDRSRSAQGCGGAASDGLAFEAQLEDATDADHVALRMRVHQFNSQGR